MKSAFFCVLKVRICSHSAFAMMSCAWGSSMLTMPTRHWVNSFDFHIRYSSKLLCSLGPIWSGEMLVNTPMSKRMPPVRFSMSPWLETSMTTALQSASTISAKASWTCQDSGVVFLVSVCFSPMVIPLVPIRPVFIPDSSRIARTMWAVVVFPLVPVMPMVSIFSAGKSNHAAESSASASLESATFRTVIPSGAGQS